MITITGLFYYPIKSCRGTPLDRAQITPRGIADDRMLMVVDEMGGFLTQREFPRMAMITPTLCEGLLNLRAPDMPGLDVMTTDAGARREVGVWNDICPAVDQGDAAAAWLGDFLGLRCRLMRLAEEHVRRVDRTYARRVDDQTSFSDGYPFLLASASSLADLNARLETPLPMDRFRPNIVVAGSDAFAEDGWSDIAVHNAHGDVRFGVVKPCARCAITTTDQATGERGPEPLRTLNTYRRTPAGKVMFAQNLLFAGPGIVAVGDAVSVSTRS